MEFDEDEVPSSHMHSIQEAKDEEDYDLQEYGKGMRTGLSIEEDEPDDEFNKREATNVIPDQTDISRFPDRDDIEDMVVAGTKTRLKHQTNDIPTYVDQNTSPSKYIDNTQQQFEEDKQELDIQTETIPVDTTNNMTQFTVHNNEATTNIAQPEPKFVNHNTVTTNSVISSIVTPECEQTVFNVKNVNSDTNPEPEIIHNNNDKDEDDEIYEDIQQQDDEEDQIDNDIEEDIEEGTFEDYQIEQDDLEQHKQDENETVNKFVPKPGLGDTEKYYLADKDLTHSPDSNQDHTSVSNHNENTNDQNIDKNDEKYKNFVSKPVQPSASALKQKVSENFNPFVENSLAKVEGWTTTANEGKLWLFYKFHI